MRRQGAIPSQIIQEFLDNGNITAETAVPPKNLQPASLDLRLGQRGYRVRASFLPKVGETIAQRAQAGKPGVTPITSQSRGRAERP